MERDPARDSLREQLGRKGVSLAAGSLAIGRNRTYLQQYLARGVPRVLCHRDSEALGKLLDCDPATLRRTELPALRPWKRKRRRSAAPGAGLATVPEAEIAAAAGAAAFEEAFIFEKARWQMPEVMVRHEACAEPEALLIVRVRGNAMEPEMRDGDRIVVDTARRAPATGELFVLWDGSALAVKRVEAVRGPGAPRLGTFAVRKRPARAGRNARTGEAVSIPASTVPSFKAAKVLRDAVNGG